MGHDGACCRSCPPVQFSFVRQGCWQWHVGHCERASARRKRPLLPAVLVWHSRCKGSWTRWHSGLGHEAGRVRSFHGRPHRRAARRFGRDDGLCKGKGLGHNFYAIHFAHADGEARYDLGGLANPGNKTRTNPVISHVAFLGKSGREELTEYDKMKPVICSNMFNYVQICSDMFSIVQLRAASLKERSALKVHPFFVAICHTMSHIMWFRAGLPKACQARSPGTLRRCVLVPMVGLEDLRGTVVAALHRGCARATWRVSSSDGRSIELVAPYQVLSCPEQGRWNRELVDCCATGAVFQTNGRRGFVTSGFNAFFSFHSGNF